AGRTMIDHVLASLAAAGADAVVVVTGHDAETVEAALDSRARTVRQDPQLGTADAVRTGLPEIPTHATQVLVTMADVPLLPADVFSGLAAEQRETNAAIVLLSAEVADPTGYGRVVRDADGGCRAIVEEADADTDTQAIREVNAGTYCFDASWLRANIEAVPRSASGEHYLTDLVATAVDGGHAVRVV